MEHIPQNIKPEKRTWKNKGNTEKSVFDEEFNKFFEDVKSIAPDYTEEVGGKMREYVNALSLLEKYKESFPNGLVDSSIRHRIINSIDEKDYPDDFINLRDMPIASLGKRYFVNRKNKDLMKKIFMPYMDNETEELVRNTSEEDSDVQSMLELNRPDEGEEYFEED